MKGKLAHVDTFPVESWINASKLWAPLARVVASTATANSPDWPTIASQQFCEPPTLATPPHHRPLADSIRPPV